MTPSAAVSCNPAATHFIRHQPAFLSLQRCRTGIAAVNRQLKLQLDSIEAETLSGLLAERTGQVPSVGDRIELDGAVAEVLDISGSRASSIRVVLSPAPSGEAWTASGVRIES